MPHLPTFSKQNRVRICGEENCPFSRAFSNLEIVTIKKGVRKALPLTPLRSILPLTVCVYDMRERERNVLDIWPKAEVGQQGSNAFHQSTIAS